MTCNATYCLHICDAVNHGGENLKSKGLREESLTWLSGVMLPGSTGFTFLGL